MIRWSSLFAKKTCRHVSKYWWLAPTLSVSVVALLLNACTLAPSFSRPEIVETAGQRFLNHAPQEHDTSPAYRWWERIKDKTLDRHITLLLQDNISLQEASERVIQARENLVIAGGRHWPALSTTFDASRQVQPTNTRSTNTRFRQQPINSTRFYSTNFNAQLTTSWELDLFGRIRSTVDAAEANLGASTYDHMALEYSLIANLLRLRVTIATHLRLSELARLSSDNQKSIYQILQRRYELGTASIELAALHLSEQSYRALEADFYEVQRRLHDQTYSLDILLGQLPGFITPEEATFPLLPPPEHIDNCLPITLLDRRPDLRAAELRAIAANAGIGIALADLYPTLSLSGAIGFTNNSLHDLFLYDQLAGSLLSSITTRLFQGGAVRANIRLQRSEAKMMVLSYTNSILNAIKEVETALRAEQFLKKQFAETQKAFTAMQRAERITEGRYRRGIIPLHELLDVQQRRYQEERNLLLVSQERWINRINLYLALGGGWLHEDDEKNTNCWEST